MPETMTPRGEAMSLLATLLEYPRASFFDDLDQAAERLEKSSPHAASKVRDFSSRLADCSVSDLEELFTRTFDMAPILCPYVTAHIYGDENFDRGRLMSALSSKFEEKGFSPGNELPDHLAVILRFAPYLSSEELTELNDYCLRQPLTEMHRTLSDAGSPYAHVLEAIQSVIDQKRVVRERQKGDGDA